MVGDVGSQLATNLQPIQTSRLELVLLTPAFLGALLKDRRGEAQGLVPFEVPPAWPGEHVQHLRMRLEQMENDPATVGWLVRAMVLKGPRRMAIGRIGFHGPPGVNGQKDPGAVELGYHVDAVYRRNGYASEAVLAMKSWASTEHGVRRVLASISPANEASLALGKRLGFVQVGTQCDEDDGEVAVFELR